MKNKHENYLKFKSPDSSIIITNMNEDKEQDISVHKKYNKLKNNILAKQDLIHRNEDNANFEDGQDTTNSNPWIIKNLEEFLYYCCPECDNKNQSKNNFINHVLSFHPMAKQYLETIESLKIENLSDCIDEENVENECDIDDFVKSENNEQMDDIAKHKYFLVTYLRQKITKLFSRMRIHSTKQPEAIIKRMAITFLFLAITLVN